MAILEILGFLRNKLLDLTGRNRLLRFKASQGKAIQFVNVSLEGVWKNTLDGKMLALDPVPEPKRAEYVKNPESGREIKPDPREYARSLGIDTSFDLKPTLTESTHLQALYYPEDLVRVARKVASNAKTLIEDKGITDPLYLIFGFLEFYEDDASDTPFLAPLLSVPVTISQCAKDTRTGLPQSKIVCTNDDVSDNLTLFEKLKAEFNIHLPRYEEDETPESYYKRIQMVIERKERWKIKRQVVLSLLSFSKEIVEKNLRPETWGASANGSNGLTDHPIVNEILIPSGVEGNGHDDEYAVDDHPSNNLPLIYDADSYQHRALIDAMTGKNLVINGPPGTGKSQTITNLIACAMHAGKKVLFVSEKLAALQVVKNRLTQAGLGKFVLELHSTNTNKRQFLDDLEDRKKTAFPPQIGLDVKLTALHKRRDELKRHAETLNSVFANELGLTVNQAIWKAEMHREECGIDAGSLKDLSIANAATASSGELDTMLSTVRRLAQHFDEIGAYDPNHPWYGFFPVSYEPGMEYRAETLLKKLIADTRQLDEHDLELKAALPDSVIVETKAQSHATAKAVGSIPSVPLNAILGLLPRLFETDGKESQRIIHEVESLISLVNDLETRFAGKLRTPNSVDDATHAEASTAYGLLEELALADHTLSATREQVKLTAAALETVAEKGVVFQDTASQAGVPYNGGSESLRQIATLIQIAHKAPHDLLGLRKAEMATPRAIEVLEKAQRHVKECQDLFSELDASFYMDAAPSEQEAQQAVNTFREGDAWYRFFQSDWRKSRKLYKRFSRAKDKILAEESSANLEKLIKLHKRREQLINSSEYPIHMGSLFQNEETDFDKARTLLTWCSDSATTLFELAIPPEIFDPTTASAITLAKLGKAYVEADEAFDDVFKAVKHLEDAASRLRIPEADSFTARQAPLKAKNDALNVALTVIEREGLETLTPKVVFMSIKDKLTRDSQLAGLEAHAEGQALLGAHFRGLSTDIKAVRVTYEWGAAILAATDNPALAKRLLQPDSPDYQEKLMGLVKQLMADWANVDAFATSMATLGAFDSEDWYGHVVPNTSHIRDRANVALEAIGGLLPWAQYLNARKVMDDTGMREFTAKLEDGAVSSRSLPPGFLYRFYSTMVNGMFRHRPELSKFSATEHSKIRQEYAQLDREIIKVRGDDLANKVAALAKPHYGSGGTSAQDPNCTELALLTMLFKQKKPRLPIRQMLRRAGKTIQEYKPCFMMSPIAVAQFLAPNAIEFDMVVMDEASQITPEDAIGAIARGKQLIVVGDPNQLPPTRFFNQSTDGDGDGDAEGTPDPDYQESILVACKGSMQERMLQFHYRSKHESLIAFSNAQFYDNKLVVFPSPYPKNRLLGLHYHYVNGEYKSNLNHAEASRVADAVIDHMVKHPDESLGVVTLNIFQRDLIEELLDKRFSAYPECLRFLSRHEKEGWPFFIKNLENVQGDERDVIYISTTFGKAPGTNGVRQNFGPISRADGWRRLNVLFTRSRKSMHVFSSMQPEDVVADDAAPEGTKAFKGFLTYAKSGYIPNLPGSSEREPDSDFEVAVAKVLREQGFSVRPQLGVAGYYIDMVVRNPDRLSEYIVAIECDGVSYHTGTAVRDRDRIRQEILESLGWKNKIWRIWSTDWYRNPKTETEKLVEFVKQRWAESKSELPEHYEEVEPQAAEPERVEEVVREAEEEAEEMASIINSLVDEDDEMFVQVGDTVTYVDVAKPHIKITITIVEGSGDREAGIVNVDLPVAQALLDAQEGDEVEMTFPDRPSHLLKVLSIERDLGMA